MRSILLSALALAACSGPAPTNDSVAAPTPKPPPRAATVAPTPADLQTFGDWTVACDNTHACMAGSLGPNEGDFPAVTMTISRGAGPSGAMELALKAPDDRTPVPKTLVVDDRRFDLTGRGALSGAGALAIARALAAGQTARFVGADGHPVGTLSLDGASATVRYIDAQQNRVDNESAMVTIGDKPAGAVPPPRPAPVIRAVTPAGQPATVSPAMLNEMRQRAKCDQGFLPAAVDLGPDLHVLGNGATLALVPCDAGAYNLMSAAFVIRNGEAIPARFDAKTGIDMPDAPRTGVSQPVNAKFDGGALTTDALGRGLGDCGIDQRFVWDGDRFRLSEQREMKDCRGDSEFLRTWTARVER